MGKLIRVYFQLITWSEGSCYAFTDSKRNVCSMTFKDGSVHRMKFTAKKAEKDSGWNTIWLNDVDTGGALTTEEAKQYQLEMCGSLDNDECWGQILPSGDCVVLSQEQYEGLSISDDEAFERASASKLGITV